MRVRKVIDKIAIISCLCWLALGGGLARAGEDYLIGAEDVLNISVWETEGLNLTVSVRPDGKISFPLVDDLQASGLTAMQLKEKITEKLRQFIKEPIVTVIVSQINSPRVFIQGEVARPGTYVLRRKSTLLELFSDVGGPTEEADLHGAWLLRDNRKLDIDFYKLLKEGDVSQNVLLLPGDYIFLPDNFAKRVTVLGEVTTPQVINFREGLTVLDAILSAGGGTKYADFDDTVVVRKDGTKTRKIAVDMEAVIEDNDLEKNFPLMPGDTVIVGESWF